MKTFFKALILLPLSLIIVLFAIANRTPVTISLDPFSQDAPILAYTLPLWVVLFGAVAVGIVIGGLSAWAVQAKHRRAERAYRREAQTLRHEVERKRETPPVASGLPALTSARA